jgi:hypothetical protein
MAGLVPAIHALFVCSLEDVDARHKLAPGLAEGRTRVAGHSGAGMQIGTAFAFFFATMMMTIPAIAAEPVHLHAAGSLRAALTEVSKAFEGATSLKVQPKYGPSGTLKNEIAGGARTGVFKRAAGQTVYAVIKASDVMVGVD